MAQWASAGSALLTVTIGISATVSKFLDTNLNNTSPQKTLDLFLWTAPTSQGEQARG